VQTKLVEATKTLKIIIAWAHQNKGSDVDVTDTQRKIMIINQIVIAANCVMMVLA
jgi:ribosomal silencing factor RsfS